MTIVVLRFLALVAVIATFGFAVASGSGAARFTLAGITAGVFIIFLVLSALLPSRPHLFNFPEKDRFLRLPSAYQQPVIAEMRVMLEAASLSTVLTTFVIQLGIWRQSTGEKQGLLAVLPHFAFLLGPAILVLLLRVTSALEREEKRWKADHQQRQA
ncbi:MAG: hypothetical protein ACYC0B_01585 [Gemmatimonadaceae bacterium]